MHDSVWFYMVLYDSLLSRMILDSYARFCVVLYDSLFARMILDSYARFCVVLYGPV